MFWISCALLFTLPSCGNDGPCGCTDEPGSLVFRRDGGSPISFPPDARAFIWCGEWEPSTVPEPALHVLFGSGVADTPGWRLKVVLDDVAVGDTLFLPNSFIWNLPDSLDFFLFDPPNELSSQVSESSGFLVFQQLGCAVGQAVEFDMDAVLASEVVGLPSVSVQGRFVGTVAEAPSAKEEAGTTHAVPAHETVLSRPIHSR